MILRNLIVPGFGLTICVFLSCGGSTETSSTGGGASAGSAGTGAANGGSAGSVGGSAGSAGSIGGSAGSAGTGVTGGSAGTGITGGSAGSGNAGGTAGAGNAGGFAGAGGTLVDGGAPSEILCGWGICSAHTEFCCVSYQPAGAGECRPLAQAGTCTSASSIAMHCDGPEDCGGQMCCGANGSGLPFVGAIECASSCPMDGMHTLFCQPWAPDTCPNGMTCKPAPLLATYYSCQSI